MSSVGWQTRGMADPATRERLLDAAWEIVTARGVDEFTLAEVGAAAGVSRQAVYLHFGNRATLLTAMAARVDHTSGFRRRLAVAQGRPPVEGFRALLDAWFGYLPTILPVALALEASWLSGGDGGEAYRDRMDDWRTAIRATVQRLGDSHDLADVWSVDDAADWVWAMIHPTHYHHLTAERGWSPRTTRRRLSESLERDLLYPSPPA